MKNYIEIERELCAIEGLVSDKPYRSNNFITPWVVGCIPLIKKYNAEISYGQALGGGYIIGFTLLDGAGLAPYSTREKYDRSFSDSEINEISEYAKSIVNKLSR